MVWLLEISYTEGLLTQKVNLLRTKGIQVSNYWRREYRFENGESGMDSVVSDWSRRGQCESMGFNIER